MLHPETANKEYIKRSSGKYICLFYPLVWGKRWEFHKVSRRGHTFCTGVFKSMFLDLSASSSLSISFHYGPFIIFYFLKLGLLTQLSLTYRGCCCCILSQFIFGCMGKVHTQLIIPSSTQEWSWGMIMISYVWQSTATSLHNNIYCMVQPIYDFIYDVGLLLFTEAERAGWMEDPFCTHDGRFLPHSVSLSVPWTWSLFQHLQISELVSIMYNFPKWCLNLLNSFEQ